MTAAAPASSHRWRFFRSGGFDQVRIETVEDLRALSQLDLKLWAALACPATGLEFDERTLQYIDHDGDGRIRAQEMLEAVRWTLERLSRPEVLFQAPGLPLSAIDTSHPEGAKLLASAQHILRNLGTPDADALTAAETADRARLFPPGQPNGDGLIVPDLAADETLRNLIADIIVVCGSGEDRSGEAGISAEHIDAFFAQVEVLQAWRGQLQAQAEVLMPLGEQTPAAVETHRAVAAKIDDFFMRARFAAYDPRAAALMNGSEDDLVRLSAQALDAGNEAARHLPLARIEAGGVLPLGAGVNPAWSGPVQAFREQVVVPLLGEREQLDETDWRQIQARLQPHLDWLAAKPDVAVEPIAEERLQEYLAQDGRARLMELVAQDLAVAEQADSLLDVDKLLRFQQNLVKLLNNFVALREFYTHRRAVFQAGRLYLDGRSFDLCLRVADAARHAAMAELSRTYLAYCDCVHKRSGRAMTIVAAVTAGSAGNLMVGRNGIFYDHDGEDWDATITRIVQNPVSLRDAFWSPYRRIGKLISDQIQKLAASREQAVEASAAAQVAAPAAPTPFDIGKFVGIFAAVGLALGAIGSALALTISSILGMPWWKLPLILLALVLLVSGPSVILAWFKLRARNLAPILDANGWAVNTEAKINIPFGTALTRLARLPEGAQRSLSDPYASGNQWQGWVLLLALVIGAAGYWAWHEGWLQPIFGAESGETVEAVDEATADGAPAP